MSEHRFRHSPATQQWVAEVTKNLKIDNVVYPGLCPRSIFRAENIFWWYKLLPQWETNQEKVIVVEFDKMMYNGLVKENEFSTIINADINDYIPPKNSVLLWSHGCEHVRESYVKFNAVPRWKQQYKAMLFFAPWGRWDQPAGSNIYEEHKWMVYEQDFLDMGFKVFTSGPKDGFGEIIGYWEA